MAINHSCKPEATNTLKKSAIRIYFIVSINTCQIDETHPNLTTVKHYAIGNKQ